MKIAIQGHSTRGKEVIQILESLGGKNRGDLTGRIISQYYFINRNEDIDLIPKTNLPNYKFYTLEEFEKEFPFKIGDKVIIMTDTPYTIIALEYYMGILCYKLDNGLNYSSNILTLYKEMKEERNITLTLDKAKKWYQKGGELKEIALQAFTKEELNPLPKSWEEYCKMYNVTVTTNIFGPCAPLKYIALWKLEQLRDCYRQGWKPDCTSDSLVDSIYRMNNRIGIIKLYSNHFLSFQSEEIVEEFKKNFLPLIKEAEDLIN